MMTYMEWCRSLELRYERMPQWYWNMAQNRDAYRRYTQLYEEMYDHTDTN